VYSYIVDETVKKAKLNPTSKIVVMLFCLAIEMKEARSTIDCMARISGVYSGILLMSKPNDWK